LSAAGEEGIETISWNTSKDGLGKKGIPQRSFNFQKTLSFGCSEVLGPVKEGKK
jgi:hypothetical protein